MPRLLTAALAAIAAAVAAPAVAADPINADAAQALIKRNQCGKCHSADKKKDGPSYAETAAKLKGKPDAEDILYKHLTTGPTIKIDGKEEQHKIIKADNEADIRNLARWILSH